MLNPLLNQFHALSSMPPITFFFPFFLSFWFCCCCCYCFLFLCVFFVFCFCFCSLMEIQRGSTVLLQFNSQCWCCADGPQSSELARNICGLATLVLLVAGLVCMAPFISLRGVKCNWQHTNSYKLVFLPKL